MRQRHHLLIPQHAQKHGVHVNGEFARAPKSVSNVAQRRSWVSRFFLLGTYMAMSGGAQANHGSAQLRPGSDRDTENTGLQHSGDSQESPFDC